MVSKSTCRENENYKTIGAQKLVATSNAYRSPSGACPLYCILIDRYTAAHISCPQACFTTYINGLCFKFATNHKNVAMHAHLVYQRIFQKEKSLKNWWKNIHNWQRLLKPCLFYYCSVNHQSGLQRNTNQNVLQIMSFHLRYMMVSFWSYEGRNVGHLALAELPI